MAQKPSIPKGTRDFSPVEMSRRNYIFDTIRSVFRLYGFRQIETPSMEQMSTLMGKYGEEGDKLLFRIQNSGEKAKEAPEKGLRYDLTVPFARYVVQHREELQFPFRRYQIQPVWRADRPQKGRYREFYQCDADVVGTDSLTSEVELIEIVEEVYRRFGIHVSLHINNRKILAGIAQTIGEPDKIIDITTAIDKLDKIGIEKVNEELLERGLSETAVNRLQPILRLSGSNEDKLQAIAEVLKESETGMQGVAEVKEILRLYNSNKEQRDNNSFIVELDLTLARGLNYYTGAIFEVKALDVAMGSITGGGRYDNLTGIFGMPGVSGVGISFGADRIYDVLAELNLYPDTLSDTTQLLFATFGKQEMEYAMRWALVMRQAGINTEVYPDPTKMKKQMSYADANHIPFVAIVGSTEMENNTVMLKEMLTGEQQPLTITELKNKLTNPQ
ncbi:MAG: histidine--tRNA ligase [Paludibacteraceae bacterium]|nr:histidine--tRNA ligase [Paludibacteraceae bacterium]